MAASDVISFEVFFDYLCPFVYRMGALIDAVGAGGRRLDVSWRYFSLTQVNAKQEGWTVWGAPEDPPVKGRLAFKAAEAARRQEGFELLHLPLLRARHRDLQDIDSREVVERVAANAGLDVDRFLRDLDDPTILDALARDHRRAVADLGIFGTPTIVFQNGAAAYVRLAEEVDAAAAANVFDRLLAVAEDEPRILEIKRPRKPAA